MPPPALPAHVRLRVCPLRSRRSHRGKGMVPRLLIGILALILSAAAHARSADPRIADLVRAGKVRLGTFPPQYTKGAKGELKGPFVEMMRAAATHMGLPIELIELQTPAKLV